MKKLISLFLPIILMLGFTFSCLAQSLQFIPVHFHIRTQTPVSISRLDEQINLLNRIYTHENAPFRFTRSSVDSKAILINVPHDLNVMVEDEIMECDACLGRGSFPWDAQFNPSRDRIDLLQVVLTSGEAKGPSGLVLAHEIGHWLGLYHEKAGLRDGTGNCMDIPHLTVYDQKCYFTSEQLVRMAALYRQFRK